ncbi:MAG: bacteriocin, partial [Moraxellaceae bacterium]
MKLQELNFDELKNVNGGLLGLGDGNSSITGI